MGSIEINASQKKENEKKRLEAQVSIEELVSANSFQTT